MITINDFAKMIKMEQELLLKQTADLTHADSLLQPHKGGNCLNWTIGHLVENLVTIFTTLGGITPTDLPDLSHYGYNSEPVRHQETGVIDFQILVDTYTHLTQLILEQLNQMTPVDFDQEIDYWEGKRRRGYIAFFYFFHNSYHLGQLEQFRNLAGKTEKVI